MTDSRRTRVDERRLARGCDRGRGQQVGEEEHGEGQEDERDVRRRKRWCSHDVKRPRGHAIATASRCRANMGKRRMLLHPLPRMGWREGEGMRGERKVE